MGCFASHTISRKQEFRFSFSDEISDRKNEPDRFESNDQPNKL